MRFSREHRLHRGRLHRKGAGRSQLQYADKLPKEDSQKMMFSLKSSNSISSVWSIVSSLVHYDTGKITIRSYLESFQVTQETETYLPVNFASLPECSLERDGPVVIMLA